MGPIEYVEFAYDEHETCENFALVIFKYASSVEDSIKLLYNTKLFRMPISMKRYSESFENPVFHEQLDYFKQLVNVEHGNQSTGSKMNDQSSDDKNTIPESLPKPPVHDTYNLNTDKNSTNYRSDMHRRNFRDDSSRHQHNNDYNKSRSPFHRNENSSFDKSYHDRGSYRNQGYNNSSGSFDISNNNRNSHHGQSHDRKHRDYNIHTSSKWKGSTFNNQEHSFPNEKISAKGILPVRDLRDTMHRKRSPLNSDYHSDTNTNGACTSVLDLRDTMYHNSGDKYEGQEEYYEPDTFNEWSDRNHKNTHSFKKYTDQESRKNNYNERYNESNTKYHNHYTDQEYYDQSSYKNKSHDDEYPNNYNESYSRGKNRPNNNKYSRNRSQHMESSSRQPNSYHPYTRSDESRERKESKNSFDNRSGHNRGRYFRGGNDRSRPTNYYSYYS